MSEPSIVLIGIVGTGAMGQGIAQLAACAGLSVLLYDSRQGAALQAREQIATVLARQVERAGWRRRLSSARWAICGWSRTCGSCAAASW